MHLSEFKAWFQGYTEEMKSTPNKAQWAKIKKRVDEISNDYTPMPVFIDRFWRPYQPYWTNTIWCSTPTNGGTSDGTSSGVYNLTVGDWSEAGRVEFRAGQ